MWICIAPCRDHTSKALRYGTRSQGISQFYLHTPRSSANGMNHTYTFAFPAEAGSHLSTPEGWNLRLSWRWVSGYIYTHVNPWSRKQHDNATSPIRVVYENRSRTTQGVNMLIVENVMQL